MNACIIKISQLMRMKKWSLCNFSFLVYRKCHFLSMKNNMIQTYRGNHQGDQHCPPCSIKWLSNIKYVIPPNLLTTSVLSIHLDFYVLLRLNPKNPRAPKRPSSGPAATTRTITADAINVCVLSAEIRADPFP